MYIIPKPVYMEETGTPFLLNYCAYIVMAPKCSEHIYRQALILKSKIQLITGYCLHVSYGKAKKGDISVCYFENRKEQPDNYQLLIEENEIKISGSEHSMIYAMQTLIQILRQTGSFIPGMVIHDYAQMKYRGFYHDVTRGRIPKLSYLKWLVDHLSEYKINQLQLYVENTYLFRDFSEVWRDDTPLTPEEILELDAYCYDREVELVPSISTFSHLYKLLRTKQYCKLCELEHSDTQPFSAWDKQFHHTIDITNEESIVLVKEMIDEYHPLFRTNKFNICADETFDLGKGRSKNYCQKIGKSRAYIEYVKKICEHLISMKCEPMMWGDIISEYPKLIMELPKEVVFLNWGYDADVSEKESKNFSDIQAIFYNCPGVSGWTRLVNNSLTAYMNIQKMSDYGKKYHAVGILNTDWGDYHHINHPEFSLIGMIYGAHFSWSKYHLEYEKLNQMISILEFGKECENLAESISQIDDNAFYSWMDICIFREYKLYNNIDQEVVKKRFLQKERIERLKSSNFELDKIQAQIMYKIPCSYEEKRELLTTYLVAIDGCKYLNLLGGIISRKEYLQMTVFQAEAAELAENLERWLYYYKQEWRRVSKESELCRIQDVISWYADYLRGIKEDI